MSESPWRNLKDQNLEQWRWVNLEKKKETNHHRVQLFLHHWKIQMMKIEMKIMAKFRHKQMIQSKISWIIEFLLGILSVSLKF